MADLKTNYVDDQLNASANQLRKYQQIKNDDGTVSFVDVTDYTATGTSFGASDINATNTAVNKNTTDISSLNLKMEVVKYSTVQSANLEYISNVGGYICKQGNVCYMGVTFTILKTRSVGSLFKFPDYLAPKDASVIGHIYNNNVEAVCGFLFPTKSHANYNNGFIRNQASLSPGVYMLRVTWIDV